MAVVRWIGEGYYLSVGNWQIRKTIRRISLKKLGEEYIRYVEKVGTDPLALLGKSAKSLTEFF